MGIPYYVASLLRVHKHIQRRLVSGYKVDLFAIDFNCFIHHALKAENPIGSIVVALHELMQTVEAKQVYIAFDGLVLCETESQVSLINIRFPLELPS
jgi:hypothetical protein